jgi:hypothetical protein
LGSKCGGYEASDDLSVLSRRKVSVLTERPEKAFLVSEAKLQ